jgi:hypothetical protein
MAVHSFTDVKRIVRLDTGMSKDYLSVVSESSPCTAQEYGALVGENTLWESDV